MDQLKLDKSLVDQIDRPRGRAVAAGIIDLGRTLGLQMVAEGIEHEHQRIALDALGCALGQGFHLARPAAAEATTRRLTEQMAGRRTVARMS